MVKKLVVAAVFVLLIAGFPLSALAASSFNTNDEILAAQNLHHLGVFSGIGTNPDGTPNFALDRQPTRLETTIMFVRLIGGAEEARSTTWAVPFTDVPAWGLPYVGYAFHNGLVSGVSRTSFAPNEPSTAAQYITLVLRALGYSTDLHFYWQTSWLLSDELGITNGRFNASNQRFTRGDLAEISFSALSGNFIDSDMTLAEFLIDAGLFTFEQALAVGVIDASRDLWDEGSIADAPEPEQDFVVAETPHHTDSWASPATGTPGTANQATAPETSGQAGPTPSPTPGPLQPTGITVSPTNPTISINQSISLSATVAPRNAANRTVRWSSSNTSVASLVDT